MKIITFLFALSTGIALDAAPSRGPKLNPVTWSLTAPQGLIAPGSTILFRLHAEIASGYHLYSLTTPPGGPIRTTVVLGESNFLENPNIYQPAPDRHQDPNLNVPVETFSGSTDISLQTKIRKDAPDSEAAVSVKVRYQACSDEICLPPIERSVAGLIRLQTGVPLTATKVPQSLHLVDGPTPDRAPIDLSFLLLAFGFGVAAIFTPCVFPTIPLTISYFLNGKQNDRGGVLRQGFLFSVGIVVLFSSLGLLVTFFAGPFGVIKLASSPWVNGLVATVFVALGLSLLGAFELALPSSLLTRVDGASRRGGVLGGLVLGLTFCLTSFACVGPFLGTLLAASVKGSIWQPVLGMFTFGVGLATPFFVLSLFPAFVRLLPRSGAWLSRVKVVSGFIVLAVSLKYLASVDQVLQLHLITRERFVAVWFSLFVVAALYLWGQIRLLHAPEKTEDKPAVGIGRLLTGAASMAFAVSLLPALWGGKLGELDAFLPVSETQASTLFSSSAVSSDPAVSLAWLKNNYSGALAQAKGSGKPLLISFSGYACTNCHWMKANILRLPEVTGELQHFVLTELFTDGTDSASAANQMLQQDRFSSVALPYYVIVDGDGKELAHQAGLTRSPNQFLSFLRSGFTSRPSQSL